MRRLWVGLYDRVWGFWALDEQNGGVGEVFVLFVCSGRNGHEIAKTRNSPIILSLICLLSPGNKYG